MDYKYPDAADPLSPNSAHAIALQLIGSGKRVLELGAYGGHVTKALRNAGNHVVAVEIDGRMTDRLREVADEVLITDLEWLDIGERLSGREFDVVLAGDVLEHCRQPDLVLLQARRLLAPGGSVIISLPNVAHGDVRLALLAGRFDYSDAGLLDRTHVRFFTRSSIEDFLSRNGMHGAEWFSTYAPVGSVTEFAPIDPRIPQETINFVASDRDSVIYQYVVRAIPVVTVPDTTESPGGGGRDTTEELLARVALLQSLVLDRDALIRSLQTEIKSFRTVIDAQDAHTESVVAASRAESAREIERLRRNHRRQLQQIHDSRAWRLIRIARPIRHPIEALRSTRRGS